MSLNSIFATQKSIGSNAYAWKEDATNEARSWSANAAVYSMYLVSKLDGSQFQFIFSDGEPYQRRGNYYGWYASTANSSMQTTAVNNNAKDSICPKGWHLPYGVTGTGYSYASGGYNYLVVGKYNVPTTSTTNDTLAHFPLNFPPAGYYHSANGQQVAVGSNQSYWSNSRETDIRAKRLDFTGGTIYAGTGGMSKGNGNTLRCVFSD